MVATTVLLAFHFSNCKCQTSVDLGLPSGTLWASCNLGGVNPWDYGDYYAWGETVLHYNGSSFTGDYAEGFTWNTYSYAVNNYINLTKYCSSAAYGKAGYTDALTKLELSDDAAQAVWGDDWVIPTYEQWSELGKNCYWEWTDSYKNKGRKGYIVYKAKDNSDKGIKNYKVPDIERDANGKPKKDRNGKLIEKKDANGNVIKIFKYKTAASYSIDDEHIFLPASGCYTTTNLGKRNSCGYYWTATLDKASPCFARDVFFGNSWVNVCDFSYRAFSVENGEDKIITIVEKSDLSRRYDGQSIRPVKKQ